MPVSYLRRRRKHGRKDQKVLILFFRENATATNGQQDCAKTETTKAHGFRKKTEGKNPIMLERAFSSNLFEEHWY